MTFIGEFILFFIYKLVFPELLYRELLGQPFPIIAGQQLANIWVIVTSIFMILFWNLSARISWSRNLLLFSLFPIYQFIMTLVYIRCCFEQTLYSVLIGNALTLFNLLLGIFLLTSINNIYETLCIEEKLTQLYKKRDLEKQYYTLLEAQIKETSQMKQDFENQLEELQTHLQQDSSSKASEACRKTGEASSMLSSIKNRVHMG